MLRSTFITLSLSLLALSFTASGPAFTSKVYGNIANYFETEAELREFFSFTKGEVIAEVGTAEGRNIAGLALLYDSLVIYAEDINPDYLNKKNLDKCLDKVRKHKPQLTCDIKMMIGTETSTLLPENTFDKILLISTLHEFSRMDEMLSDIGKKLRPRGKVYVLESVCGAKGHRHYTVDEVTVLMKKQALILSTSDGKDLHGSLGLYRAVYMKQ
jgi:ubiquinone/menaquinone biosynthesis C-methylase UbiE